MKKKDMNSNKNSTESNPFSRLSAPEAIEAARSFEENPADGTALLRLCVHHLAAGENTAVQEAMVKHVSSDTDGSHELRLRLTRSGELLPEQRAELLIDLSHVEEKTMEDLISARSSARKALEVFPPLASARARFEELSRNIDSTEMSLDDQHFLDALEDEPVTDPGFRAVIPPEGWTGDEETDSDIEPTIRIALVPEIQSALISEAEDDIISQDEYPLDSEPETQSKSGENGDASVDTPEKTEKSLPDSESLPLETASIQEQESFIGPDTDPEEEKRRKTVNDDDISSGADDASGLHPETQSTHKSNLSEKEAISDPSTEADEGSDDEKARPSDSQPDEKAEEDEASHGERDAQKSDAETFVSLDDEDPDDLPDEPAHPMKDPESDIADDDIADDDIADDDIADDDIADDDVADDDVADDDVADDDVADDDIADDDIADDDVADDDIADDDVADDDVADDDIADDDIADDVDSLKERHEQSDIVPDGQILQDEDSDEIPDEDTGPVQDEDSGLKEESENYLFHESDVYPELDADDQSEIELESGTDDDQDTDSGFAPKDGPHEDIPHTGTVNISGPGIRSSVSGDYEIFEESIKEYYYSTPSFDDHKTHPGLIPLVDIYSGDERHMFTNKPPVPHEPNRILVSKCAGLAEMDKTEALGILAALEEKYERNVDRAFILRTAGQLFEAAGSLQKAFRVIAKAGLLSPPDRTLLDELFRLAIMTGSYDSLAKKYRTYLNLPIARRDRVYLHLKLGHLLARELARPEEAIDHYREVMSLEPSNIEAMRRLSELLERDEMWEEVASIKRQELETVWLTTRDIGRSASIKRELAKIYEEKLGEYQKALVLYRELLDLTPDNPAAIAGIARIKENLQDDEASRNAFEMLRSHYKKEGSFSRLADLLSNRANEMLDIGKHYEAAKLHQNAARTYEERLDDPGRAFMELVRALQLLPKSDLDPENPDDKAIIEITDKVFNELLRTGRSVNAHEQLMDVGEELAARAKGARGASYLVRLFEAELEDLGNAEGAAKRLADAVELSGNDPELESRLESFYVSRRSWPELSEFYRARAARLSDKKSRVELLFRLAEILEDEMKEADSAAKVYEEIISIDGGNTQALSSLCKIHENARNWKDLVEALERTASNLENTEFKKASLLKKARIYLEKLHDPDAAKRDWQAILEIDSQCVEALQGIAESVSDPEEARNAAEALEMSLSGLQLGEPGRVDAYRRLARLYGNVLKQSAKARIAWEEVIDELPADDEAFEHLRSLYRDREILEPWARLLADRLASFPNNPESRNWRRERIEILEKLGRGDEVGKEWWHAAVADPSDIEAHSKLTAYHTARGNWKLVIKCLKKWLSATTDSREKAELHFRTAEVHRHQFNDIESAVASYRKALSRKNDHTGAQSALIEIFRHQEKWTEILPLLEARLQKTTEPQDRKIALTEIWDVSSHIEGDRSQIIRQKGLAALKEACLLGPGDNSLWQSLQEELSFGKRLEELAGLLEARAARQDGIDRATSLFDAAMTWQKAGYPEDLQDDSGDITKEEKDGLQTGKSDYPDRDDDSHTPLMEERFQERMRRCLERARDASPHDHPVMIRILSHLRNIYSASGAWEALAGILEQITLPDISISLEERKQFLDDLAWLLSERLGRPLEAIKHLEVLIELSTTDSEKDGILGRLITLNGGLGNWHKVVTLLEERVRLHRGTEREADLLLAAADIAERRLNRLDEALIHLRAAIAIKPADPDTLHRIAGVCNATGRYAEHAAIVTEECKRISDPDIRSALLVRAANIKAAHLNDPAGARRDIESALALEDCHDESILKAKSALMPVLLALGDYDDLAAMYREKIEMEKDPVIKADLIVALGLLQEEQGQSPSLIVRTFTSAYDTDPGNTVALDTLGKLAESAGNTNAAIEMRKRQAEVSWLPSRKASLLSTTALLHEQLGNREQALEYYEMAEKANPRSSQALRGRLRLLRELGRGKEALETARTLTEVAEEPMETAALWITIGENLEDEGDNASALDAYEKALSAVPEHGQACAALARIRLREGDPEAALKLLDIASERLTKDNDIEGLADVHRQAAAACEKLGRPDEAHRKLHEAYRLGPTRRTTLEALAWHFSSRKDPIRTHKLLSTLLDHYGQEMSRSEKASVLRRLGLSLAAMGRPGDASRKLNEALAISPRDRDVLSALSAIYENNGRWAEVVEIKRKLLSISNSKKAQRRLSLEIADLYSRNLHNAQGAADTLSSALRSHRNDPEILARLAEEKEKLGLFEDAAICLETLVKHSPGGGRSRLWIKLGRLRYEHQGDPDMAVSAYEKAIETAIEAQEIEETLQAVRELSASTRDPHILADMLFLVTERKVPPDLSKSAVLKELAEVLRYQLGDFNGSIDILEKVLELEPDDIGVMEDLSRLYVRNDQKEKAVDALRKVISFSPFNVDAYRSLINVLEKLEEMEAAALIASLLVLMEEADESAEKLASTLSRSPVEGRILVRGPSTPGLIHPNALNPIGDILDAAGLEGIMLFANQGRQPRARPLTEEAGPLAEKCNDAIGTAARIFNIIEPEVFLGPDEMISPMIPSLGPRPRILVSAALAEGSLSIGNTELNFHVGRAVFGTLPRFIAARLMGLDQMDQLIRAALLLAGHSNENDSDSAMEKSAGKLERKLNPERLDSLSAAVEEYRTGKKSQDIQAYVEGVQHTVIRAGLLMSGNPETAVSSLKKEGSAGRHVLRELVRFTISDEHLNLREFLGWSTS